MVARTSRSLAYAQAMRRRGLRVSEALIFGTDVVGQGLALETIDTLEDWPEALVPPDHSESLDSAIADIADEVIYYEASDINDPSLVKQIAASSASLAIYSGYGGQIVGSELLNSGPPILHIHAGWLPRFRGSTTAYYEMLIEGRIGASAIILDEGIDEGSVVSRKRYPPAPDNVNVDHVYEPAIRADLLCDVLCDFYDQECLTTPEDQNSDEAEVFFIIHPVLKHLALLGYVHEDLCA